MRLHVVMLLLLPAIGISMESEELALSVGDSRILALDLKRAALGNGNIVSLSTPEKGQLLILGEATGSTTAQLWLKDGSRKQLKIVVHPQDLRARLGEVRQLLEGIPSVSARQAGDRIVLEGALASESDQKRAASIAALFPGLVMDFVGQLGWESMVQMDVRIVEIRRDQLRQLGLRWATDAAGPQLSVDVGPGPDSIALAMHSVLTSRIDLLEQRGLAQTIAEPTLSCRSGGSARFVAGGEIPLPITDALGAVDVQYKEYGVILEVRPRADPSGAISAEVDVELSQVDPSMRVRDFPAFIKRRSSTAINSRAGETMVISGLIARERSGDRQGIPGLGRMPVAGRLFSSVRSQERQTELLVLITARQLHMGSPGNPDAADSQESMRRRADDIGAASDLNP